MAIKIQERKKQVSKTQVPIEKAVPKKWRPKKEIPTATKGQVKEQVPKKNTAKQKQERNKKRRRKRQFVKQKAPENKKISICFQKKKHQGEEKIDDSNKDSS